MPLLRLGEVIKQWCNACRFESSNCHGDCLKLALECCSWCFISFAFLLEEARCGEKRGWGSSLESSICCMQQWQNTAAEIWRIAEASRSIWLVIISKARWNLHGCSKGSELVAELWEEGVRKAENPGQRFLLKRIGGWFLELIDLWTSGMRTN